MQRTLTFCLLALAGVSTAAAQHQTSARRAPNSVKNAGVYHPATGTWTRASSSVASFGPDVIYTNTSGNNGYFVTLGLETDTGQSSIIDEGRLPDTSSLIDGVDRDNYEVNGLAFSYCTDVAGPNVDFTFRIYESYQACDLPSAPAGPLVLSGSSSTTGLPGAAAPGAVTCWTLTIDLDGGDEFCVLGEGGSASPGHQGGPDDGFGIEFSFDGLFGTSTGMMLAGDPSWTASVPGAVLHGGTGTYYSNTLSCADTGLDTLDFVAVDGATSLPAGPACYFFGGYDNPNGCTTPPVTPFASFAFTLFGDEGECDLPPMTSLFCDPASPNSSGKPASLSAFSTNAGAGVRLEVSDGAGDAGFFLVSAGNSNMVNISSGVLCLSGAIARYAPQVGGEFNSLGVFSPTGEFVNVAGTSTTGFGYDIPTQIPGRFNTLIDAGSTWHFQLWFRDLSPSGSANFSNGISVTF